MSWERLSIHKKERGLGFKNPCAFNEVMLGNLWRNRTTLLPRLAKILAMSETNGIYSVRSGYRISLSQHLDLSAHRCDGNWALLWNLKVPPKVKSCLWRSCRNALPTRVRLQDRGVNCKKNLCFMREWRWR